MPYITKQERDVLLSGLKSSHTPGQLNFMISSLIAEYIADNGTRYETINDILGALEGAKLELYRRIAVPYENEKLTMNGDVYGVKEKQEKALEELTKLSEDLKLEF